MTRPSSSWTESVSLHTQRLEQGWNESEREIGSRNETPVSPLISGSKERKGKGQRCCAYYCNRLYYLRLGKWGEGSTTIESERPPFIRLEPSRLRVRR